jgi:hypothetical protein
MRWRAIVSSSCVLEAMLTNTALDKLVITCSDECTEHIPVSKFIKPRKKKEFIETH